MRKDNKPYFLKKFSKKLEKLYVKHFLEPQFDYLGKNSLFMKPWNVEIFGSPIKLGNFATVIAASDKIIRFSVWSTLANSKGKITIGNFCLICPGVRISSACEILIGNDCMIASSVYITDCDWHGVYDRVAMGNSLPVKLEDNVWVGDSAIICKGVTIGQNSIIGAGSVVVKSIPANSVAVGNPAVVVKDLDINIEIKKRSDWLKNYVSLAKDFDTIDKKLLEKNTIFNWLRSLICPNKTD